MLSHGVMVEAGVCGLVGLGVALGVTPLVRGWAVRRNLLDRAAQFHTTHTVAVPRVGGVALVTSFGVVVLLILGAPFSQIVPPNETGVIVLTCLAMFLLGFLDDLHPLGARMKLFVQVLISIAAHSGGLGIGQWVNPFTQTVHHLGMWDGVFTVLWLVGITNLINLVDGIDGLAAGVGLFLMVLLAVVAGTGRDFFVLMLAVGMAGALLGFLHYNFPPARIFMGDGGAYFLGFLIAELALLNAHKGEVAVALMVPFFALGLPIIDASFTILRRGLLGLPIFRADSGHIHHRLVAMGFSRQRVVLLLYGFCVFFSLLSLGVFVSKGRLLPVFFGIFMVAMLLSLRAFGFVQSWYVLGRVITVSALRRKHTRYALLLGKVLLIEAERCVTLDDLWREFGYTLGKLGFHAAEWRSTFGEHRWRRDDGEGLSPGDICLTQELRGVVRSQFDFRVEPGKWDEATFQLLAELAAESWGRALARWQTVQRFQR